MSYYNEFKKDWLPIYVEQFKTSNNEQRGVIKENIFKNINFTEKQKEQIWNEIIRRSEILRR